MEIVDVAILKAEAEREANQEDVVGGGITTQGVDVEKASSIAGEEVEIVEAVPGEGTS